MLLPALDPARSVVVEACAGSGKTWLLTSRIIRLLLAGVAPGEILAITFTRKAAAEIEARLDEWLADLAIWPDDKIDAFLAERGVPVGENTELRRRARGLFEYIADSDPGLAIHTFHAWFLRLAKTAPLSSGLHDVGQLEDGERRFELLWRRLAREIDRLPEVAAAWRACLDRLGEAGTRRLLRTMIAHRVDWFVYTEGMEHPVDEAMGRLAETLGIGEDDDPVADYFSGNWREPLQAYVDLLSSSELADEVKVRDRIASAMQDEHAERVFARLCDALMTDKGGPRLRLNTWTKAMDKRLGVGNGEEAVSRYNALYEEISAARQRQIEKEILAFNRMALTLGAAFIQLWDEDKAARGLIDFDDAEWRVLGLLRDESSAAFIQARLDARYRHILVDEFQDTNPLQWQILHAWLDAYGEDSERPVVFLVGDPKQSIYRFRRAEARLFEAAKYFLLERFNAVVVEHNVTRRNARAIVDVVNQLFGDADAFKPFTPQQSLALPGQPGFVELVPLFGDPEDEQAGLDDAPAEYHDEVKLRDPLTEALIEPGDQLRREAEAEYLADRIGSMVGRLLIADAGAQGGKRPLEYSDVMILCRTRTYLGIYERALRNASIPYVSANRGSLMQTLEANDIVALLRLLSMPADAMALAQVLRSPIFCCDNEDLIHLARMDVEVTWLQKLDLCHESEHPRLARAARLLKDWLTNAAFLPTHDLLDRIYHQADIPACYRAVVPEEMAAGVEANLLAILHLALDLDGGRYPSLPRFIAELEARRDLTGDEALNEGPIDIPEGKGRVRILTIHSAKGLEAPLVWLIDANNAGRNNRGCDLLVHWPPQEMRPDHVSWYDAQKGSAREAFFAEEAKLAEREALNLLYVAMTRARQMLFCSAIKGRSNKAETGTAHGLIAQALEALGSDHVYGVPLPAHEIDDDGRRAEIDRSMPAVIPFADPVGERRQPPDGSARFGIVLHAILEKTTLNAGFDPETDTAFCRQAGCTVNEIRAALPVAHRLLQAPHLQRFFDPARYLRAWNELEVAGKDGVLRRLDRLVELEEAFWVLDYKSSNPGAERRTDYRAQVQDYCAVVKTLYPDKPVRGGLIFSDASLVEVECL